MYFRLANFTFDPQIGFAGKICNFRPDFQEQKVAIWVRCGIKIFIPAFEGIINFLPSGPKVPLLLSAADLKGCIFGLTKQNNRIYAPREQIKNVSDRIFIPTNITSSNCLRLQWI